MRSGNVASALAALLLTTASLPAQEPAHKQDPPPREQPVSGRDSNERLFLVYAVEDLYRDTWAAADSQRVRSSYDLRRFLASQRKLADGLRLHVSRKAGMEPELVELVDGYRKLLDVTEPFLAKLEEREQKYLEYLVKLRKDFATEDQLRRMAARAEVLDTAVEAGVRAGSGLFSDPTDMLAGGLFAGVAKSVAVEMRLEVERNKAAQKAQAAADAYEKKNKPALERDIEQYNREFFESFPAARKERLGEAQRAVAVLAKKYHWSGPEADFDPLRPWAQRRAGDRPRDPFRVKRFVDKPPRPKNLADAAVCLAQAKECLAAVRLVPEHESRSTSEVYGHYKAVFSGVAGRLANAAAAEQIGATGFKGAVRAPAPAAATARDAWVQYRKYEPASRDARGAVLHQHLLALAYGGHIKDAYEQARKASSVAQNDNPLFWYDAARVCSLSGDVKNGFYCLEKSVRLGLKNLEEVKVTADLDNLRRGDRSRFDKTVGGG